MTTPTSKILGEPLTEALRARQSLYEDYTGKCFARHLAGPTDLAITLPRYGWWNALAIDELPRELFEGPLLWSKLEGLSLNTSDDALVDLLLAAPLQLKSLSLWADASPRATALLGSMVKKVRSVTLAGPHLRALDQVPQETERLVLVGATDAQVLAAAALPKLQYLELRGRGLPASVVSKWQPKLTLAADGTVLCKRLFALPATELAAVTPQSFPTKVPMLVVQGPGEVDVDALGPWVAGVAHLAFEGVTLTGDLASLADKRRITLRLVDCEVGDLSKLVAKSPKLSVLDVTGTDVDAPRRDGLRIRRCAPAPEVPMPPSAAFDRLAAAGPAAVSGVLTTWLTRMGSDLQTMLYSSAHQTAAKGLDRVDRQDMWVKRYWAVQDSLHSMERQLPPFRPAAYRHLQTLDSAVRQQSPLDRWERVQGDARALEGLALLVAQVAHAASRWHDTFPSYEPGVDATPVIQELERLEADALPEVLPFPELDGLPLERQVDPMVSWTLRSLTSVLLELPAAKARALRKLRTAALLGDINPLMQQGPLALVGSPRAEALGKAIAEVGVSLHAGASGALGVYAFRLRRLYEGDGEARAQEMDLRPNRQRYDPMEMTPARERAWFDAVLPHTSPAVQEHFRASRPGQPPRPPVLGGSDDGWGHQIAFWLDLLDTTKGAERESYVPMIGRDMARWVGREALMGPMPPPSPETRFADQAWYLHKRTGFDVLDPLTDGWMQRIVDVVLEQHDDPELRRIRASWSAGTANRIVFRWPTFGVLLEPVKDPWLRTWDVLGRLGDDAVVTAAKHGLHHLIDGALAGDDWKGWVGELGGVVVELVPGATWEALTDELDEALETASQG